MLMDLPAAVQTDNDGVVRERLRRIKAAAELGLARASRGRQWGRALRRRALLHPKDAAAAAREQQPPLEKKTAASLETAAAPRGNDDEAEEVEEKVALLRQLVPGGEGMEVDGLLEETADYIAALKAQVGVMRALACVLSGAGFDAMLPAEKKADGHLEK